MRKKKNLFIGLITLIIIFGIAGTAYAYLTYTTDKAVGTFKVQLSDPEIIIKNENENISVTVTDNSSLGRFIRIKVISPLDVEIKKQDSGNWYWQDDYLYYSKAIKSGQTIAIPQIEIVTDKENGEKYTLRYVAEAIEAFYDESGNEYANWSQKVEGE